MARVSTKALRPRQYVFNRLSEERIRALSGAVRKLTEREKHEAVTARAATQLVKEHQAAKHAEKIILGSHEPEPETESIRQLEKELEELSNRRKQLFDKLKRQLDMDGNEDKIQPVKAEAEKSNEQSTWTKNGTQETKEQKQKMEDDEFWNADGKKGVGSRRAKQTGSSAAV